MNLSERLKTKCAEMASDGCLDELLALVEKQAFTRWKAAQENAIGPSDVWHRAAYQGQVELVNTMRNIGNSGMI